MKDTQKTGRGVPWPALATHCIHTVPIADHCKACHKEIYVKGHKAEKGT